MEDELVIIFPGVIMILIVIGLTINGVVGKVLDYKREGRALTGAGSSQHVHEVAERQEMIEDRLRVLERLATDRGQLLSDEIDALRTSALTDTTEHRNA